MAGGGSQSSVVASSSTLWATASKEWVIPAKPKPGRKPKKDSAPPKESIEVSDPTLTSSDAKPTLHNSMQVDSKGRRVQNRAAQRAFRERKQSQLAELQARVQSYEQGEIERNVALQQISKRLKSENEDLKKENVALKEELARLRKDNGTGASGADDGDGRNLKRWRETSAGVMLNGTEIASVDATSRKRHRADTTSPNPSGTPAPMGNHPQQSMAYMPSPPSLASSPDSNGVPGRSFSPLPFVSISAPGTSANAQALFSLSSQQSSTTTSAVFPSQAQRLSSKPYEALGASPTFDSFDCGLCSDNTPCVCREFAMQQAMAATVITGTMQEYSQTYQSQLSQAQGQGTMKVEDAEFERNLSPSVIEIPPAPEDVHTPSRVSATKSPSPAAPLPVASSSSILDNLPAFQPAIPLRRNATAQNRSNSTPYQIRLSSPESDSNTASSARPVAAALPTLPRRKTTGTVWQTVAATASVSGSTTPKCSGDPSNCPACKDDDFGKAFCQALGDSACSSSPCATCPNPEACAGKSQDSQSLTSTDNGVVRMIQLTPMRPDCQLSASSSTAPSASIAPQTSSSNSSQTGKIPVNEAWARLKSHPGIAFADLTMLADVVARRTKCSGPVTVIHPPPGAATPDREAARSPAHADSKASSSPNNMWEERPNRKDDSPVLLTDPHAHYKAQEQHRALFGPSTSVGTTSSRSGIQGDSYSSPPPVLVPQEELRECGRRRIREVDAAGVRDALRILDAQFGRR